MTDPITREERAKIIGPASGWPARLPCRLSTAAAYEAALAAAEARVKDQRERIDRLEEHCFCLGEALTEIAEQPLAEMMGAEEFLEADFIGAYDCCIRRARKAMEG